jgi:hypothetical protein
VDRVEAWWRHACCEPAQEREWIHIDRDRAISVGLLQGDSNEAVWTLFHSLLLQLEERAAWPRATQDVAQQCLAANVVESARANRRMQGKPIKEAHRGLS